MTVLMSPSKGKVMRLEEILNTEVGRTGDTLRKHLDMFESVDVVLFDDGTGSRFLIKEVEYDSGTYELLLVFDASEEPEAPSRNIFE